MTNQLLCYNTSPSRKKKDHGIWPSCWTVWHNVCYLFLPFILFFLSVVGGAGREMNVSLHWHIRHTRHDIVWLRIRGTGPGENLYSIRFRVDSLIARPHLLVRATSERFPPARATFRSVLASESHCLQPLLVLTVRWWASTSVCGWAIRLS